MIDYSIYLRLDLRPSFVYRDRVIRSGFQNRNGFRIYMYLDKMLMAEESSTFIKMIAEGRRKQKEFQSEYMKFRKISILSNLKDDHLTIYNLYKQREEIEQAFDTMNWDPESNRHTSGTMKI